MPDYRTTSLAAAVIWICLCICLATAPSIVYWIFDLDAKAATDVLALRAAMLFLGLAALAFLSRDEPASSLRSSVALSFGLAMGGLIIAGLFEFSRGTVGPGIWLAIVVEAAIMISYLRIWRGTTPK